MGREWILCLKNFFLFVLKNSFISSNVSKWDLSQECTFDLTSKNPLMLYTTWRIMDKKYVIMSTNAEKLFCVIQHQWLKKKLNKPRVEGNFPNMMKDIYKKATANIIIGWKTECFHPKIRNKARMFAFSLLFNIILVVPASAVRQKGRKKLSIHIGQEKVKISICRQHGGATRTNKQVLARLEDTRAICKINYIST